MRVLNGSTDEGVSAEEKLLYLIGHNSTSEEDFIGRTKLTKLGFFSEYWDQKEDVLTTDQTIGEFNYYIFKHGPFSKDLFDAFDSLKSDGFLTENRRAFGGSIISITDKGREKNSENSAKIDDCTREQIRAVSEEFGNLRGGRLEDLSMEYLQMDKSEKEDYQGVGVSEVIDERVNS